MQETHLSKSGYKTFEKLRLRNPYYSSFEKGSKREVAILVPNRVNFQFTSQIADKEGQYLLVKCFIDHKEETLLNVYRPPGCDKELIKKDLQFNIRGSIRSRHLWTRLECLLEPLLGFHEPDKKRYSLKHYISENC